MTMHAPDLRGIDPCASDVRAAADATDNPMFDLVQGLICTFNAYNATRIGGALDAAGITGGQRATFLAAYNAPGAPETAQHA